MRWKRESYQNTDQEVGNVEITLGMEIVITVQLHMFVQSRSLSEWLNFIFLKISLKDPMTGMTIEDFETEFKPQHKIGGLVIIKC